tara:strand:+ start:1168 stop:1434 length:267 start_codon:yes stop_codon:yes gene_type:complete
MSTEEKSPAEVKENDIVTYVKSLATIEYAMEPFKEQKKSLRASFVEDGRLSKEEINMAVRCYRMLKKNEDIDDLVHMFNQISKKVTGV